MKDLIENFITENKLDLTETGSALNSACCILSGYALYIGIEDSSELIGLVNDITTSEADAELARVFTYAKSRDYQNFWTTEIAKAQYTF